MHSEESATELDSIVAVSESDLHRFNQAELNDRTKILNYKKKTAEILALRFKQKNIRGTSKLRFTESFGISPKPKFGFIKNMLQQFFNGRN